MKLIDRDKLLDTFQYHCGEKDCESCRIMSKHHCDLYQTVMEQKVVEHKCSCKNKSTGENKYWTRISEIAQKQTEKGLAKYGKGLEDNVCMDVLERIQMIEEELVDALFYLEHLKECVKSKEDIKTLKMIDSNCAIDKNQIEMLLNIIKRSGE